MAARLVHRIKTVGQHLIAAVRDFRHVASVVPSSRFTIRSIARQIAANPSSLVEYGAGTGNVTRGLLEKLSPTGRLVSVELNPQFLTGLRSITDPRFSVLAGVVPGALPTLHSRFPQGVDAIVSGIPFTMIAPGTREQIFSQSWALLRKGGRFIAYQNSRLVMPLFRKHFEKAWVFFEARNFPPYFIMVGEK